VSKVGVAKSIDHERWQRDRRSRHPFEESLGLVSRALDAPVNVVGARRRLLARAGGLEDVLLGVAERLHAEGLDVSMETVQGDPAEVLVAVAEQSAARLFIVGSRERGGVAGLLLGTVGSRSPSTPGATC
jgi:nucleotide-binding universal stress UspA family protein